ncbi:hypothetical protein M885DRAFT_494425 [Pelagophyceae sp. CCMP2097]|nr:hypothetical protein M885DRAFT_494425 [Pelagophyceae sp. CCMP2097]
MCSQKTGECIRPMCTDLAEHCHESSVVGIRARQYCPATCGCDDPRSPLVLSMPESGCGYQCARNGAYLERLAGIPCEDVAPDDADLQEILADGLSVSESWPADWKTAYSMFTHGMTVHGCHYLNASFLATLPDPPVYWPYDNAINMCAGRGAYFPLKALSYFCPVVCGCRAGDAHCPPSCPERKPQSPICPGYMRDYYTGWCPMAQGHHADRTAG